MKRRVQGGKRTLMIHWKHNSMLNIDTLLQKFCCIASFKQNHPSLPLH
uniref:Uncharacterized protein n=1 Tax=Rhizophora mucronata TaxID=61149 RepID=A0A2P2PE63_RHIMU